MKRIIQVFLLLAISLYGVAQNMPTRAQLQPINATGYSWQTGAFKNLYLPRDTAQSADSGAVAIVGNMLYIKNIPQGGVYYWGPITGGGGGVSPAAPLNSIQFNNSGVFGGDAGLTYNSIVNTFSTDSIKNIRSQTDTIYSAIMPNYYADTVYFFGDSYVSGVGATSNTYRWSTKFTGFIGLVEKNMGVSGSTLMKRTPIDPYGATNLIDRINDIPSFGNKKGWLVIAYGFNDMGYNGANYTPANFRIDYQSVIDTVKARGWPTNRVILVAPYYASSETYSNYAATTGTPINTRQRHIEFIDSVQAVASFNSTRFVNPFAAQLANDSTQLFAANDPVHNNNWGHAIISQAVYNSITDTVARNGQTLAINGNSEFQNIYLSNEDTIPYTSPVLGIGPDRKIGMFNSSRIIRANPINQPQPGNIAMIGRGLFGGITSPNEIDYIQVNGSASASGFRSTGSEPVGFTGESINMFYTGGIGYIYAREMPSNTAKPISLNPFGSNVRVGTTASSGGDEKLYIGGGVKSDYGQFIGAIGSLTNPGVEIGMVSGNGYVGAYNRTANTPLQLLINGLGGNVSIGTFTDNGYKLQVNGAISTVTDSTGSPKNIAWIDTDGKIRKAAAPVAGVNLANSDLSANADHTHNFHGFNQTLDSIGAFYVFSKGTRFGRVQRTGISMLSNTSLPLSISSVSRNLSNTSDSTSSVIQAGALNESMLLSNANVGTGKMANVNLKSGTGTYNSSTVELIADTVKIAIPVTSSSDSVLVGGPIDPQTNTTPVLKMAMQKFLKGSTTWQPGTVAAGSSTTTTISVTGAALGDPVTVSKASGAYSNGEVYDAFVSAVNVVTVRVHNVSTGSANYNTTETYKVVVLKY